jgi:hypothetical protein
MTTGGSIGDSAVVVVNDNKMKDTGGTPPLPPGATSSSASLATYNLEMAAAPPLAVVVPSMLETKTSEEHFIAGAGVVSDNSQDHSTSPVP